MTLFNLWAREGKNSGLRVRWADWNWRHKFFTIASIDPERKTIAGTLDCGESISYPCDSLNWSLYHDGDEHNPRAS